MRRGGLRLKIIPAIDLKSGRVVHARGGARARYRPLRTPLFPDARPADVAARLADFNLFYIADLDALGGGAPQTAAIEAWSRARPDAALWIDRGVRNLADFEAARRLPGAPIVATETLADARLLGALAGRGADWILSLDFERGRLRGDARALAQSERWPHTVLVLSLDAVGAQAGPDLQTVAAVRARNPRSQIVAGGGVRSAADLRALARAGASAALVASALYTGKLTASA